MSPHSPAQSAAQPPADDRPFRPRPLRGPGGARLLRAAARRLALGDVAGALFRLGQSLAPSLAYRLWRRRGRAALAAPAPAGQGPLFSLILDDGPCGDAAATAAGLLAQSYPRWELLVRGPAPVQDPRVRALPPGTDAVEAAAGDYVGLVGAGDAPAPEALALAAAALAERPDTDLLYTDEELADAAGRPRRPVLKPAFDPDLLLCRDFIGRLALIRAPLAREAAPGPQGDRGYGMLLRAAFAAGQGRVRHLALPLYRRSTGIRPADAAANLPAVQGVLDRHAPGAVAEPVGPVLRVRWPLPQPVPPVSVVVPTKDRVELLRPCLEAVLDRTQYPALELIVVDHESQDPATRTFLDAVRWRPGVRILPYSGPFNFSDINNRAAEAAAGEVLVFLNNDVEPLGPYWLNELVAQALRPGVGAVGAKLLYPEGTVQHGGIVLGLGGGVAGHRFQHESGDDPGEEFMAVCAHATSAVTGACMAVRRGAFEAVGGFDAQAFPVAFNDVDLCLRLNERGLRTVWTPHAVLIHKESASLGRPRRPERREQFAREEAAFRGRWGTLLGGDPVWHPLRSLEGPEAWLAWPPTRPESLAR
ncbi:MAG TPA: glycosyltransferase family 2 protein [Azospirillaceae bacterium]|nr:glycosyltransferase family 2 protein [Azospirillaceae bacterium]